MTGNGSDFAHGYTARIVINGKLHTYGEGDAVMQAIPAFSDWVAEILWQDKNNENIESVPDSECPCED
jgi:hypothetical protein